MFDSTDPALTKSLLLAGIHFGEALVWLDGVCGGLFIGLGVRLALDRQ